MTVEALNVGRPREETFSGRKMKTAIAKRAASGPVRLTTLGFEGDGVGNPKVHGGPDKAVCVYGLNHYPFWEETLGAPLPKEAFGENLSVSSIDEEAVSIGDVFRLGSALVQVSQPRQPCSTLAARLGRPDMVRLVVETGRTGFYLRVLQEGEVVAGCQMEPEVRDDQRVSVAFAFRTYNHDKDNRQAVQRVLSVEGLSESWRKAFEKLLDRSKEG